MPLFANTYFRLSTILSAIETIGKDGDTALLAVYSNHPEYKGPMDYATDNGFTVYNVSTSAVRNFYSDEEVVSFSARFNGEPTHITIPLMAVSRVYSQENPQNYVDFPVEIGSIAPPKSKPKKGWQPKLIKGGS